MKRAGILAALALAAAGCAPADRINVIDGGHAEIYGHRIALYGVIAPKLNAKCDKERDLAQRAKARLTELLGGGAKIEFRKTGMACLQFMTCTAFVKANGADVSDRMIADALVADKSAQDGQKPDFCSGLAPVRINLP